MAHAFSSVAAQTKDKPNHGLHTKGNAWWMAGGVTGPRRPNMFENSIRVPLLVRWPGTVKPGTVINEVAGNPDTFATVLGMLKLPMPKNVKQEGADFSPLLRRRNWPNLVLPASEKFVPTDVDFAHPIYETSFDDPAVLKDWKLEGGKQMSVAGGN
ncbi:MAG: sulfatase/phosphatase domain-containing protein, partial [Blastocatellia bacterium]